MRMIRLPLAVVTASVMLACSDSGTEPPPTPTDVPVALRIAPDGPALRLGEAVALVAVFVDSAGRPVSGTGNVSWSSSNDDIIGADADGVITARTVGRATITARSGNLSGSTEAVVRAPTPTVGTNVPVTAIIDASGGSITATAADGTRHTLTVPAHALAAATQITLTPLASMEDFPTQSGASAAVQFEPDGLTFAIPAELMIVAPEPFDPATIAFSQADAAFAIEPAVISGDSARLSIGHFSSSGTTAPTASEIAVLAAGAITPRGAALYGIARELHRAGEVLEHPDAGVIEQHLRAWFTDGVMPGLEAAASGTADTEDALSEWLHWSSTVTLWADGQFTGEIGEASAAAVAAVRAEIGRLNQRCAADNDPSLMGEVLRFAGIAALLGFDQEDPALDLAAVVNDLCIQISIDATLPDPFIDGSTLEITAGLSVGGRAPEPGQPLDIVLTSATSHLSRAGGTTDSNGRFTTDVTLRAGESEVIIEIEAIHPEHPLMRSSHTVTADLAYELVLTVNGGKSTEVGPGDEASLGIVLKKAEQPHAGQVAVAIVDGGGSIAPALVMTESDGSGSASFTAPDETDAVLIVATFTEGSRAISDSVTIHVTEVSTSGIVLRSVYQHFRSIAWVKDAEDYELNEVIDEDDSGLFELNTLGVLDVAYSPAADAYTSIASGSGQHRSEVWQPASSNVLLEARGNANAEGSASTGPDIWGGASFWQFSGVTIGFEVLDEPVYYEFTGSFHNYSTAFDSIGEGYARLAGPGETGTVLVYRDHDSGEDSVVASGWLSTPGIYQFRAEGHIDLWPWGERGSRMEHSGEIAFDFEFRILATDPNEEGPP